LCAYTVLAATDADAAFERIAGDDPDLLLLDVHLGSRDGFEIAEHIRQLGPSCQRPIIFFTGDNSNWTLTISAALGARALMQKPLRRKELLQNVRLILG
jgi:CheY-like chemotaxis protein